MLMNESGFISKLLKHNIFLLYRHIIGIIDINV